MYRQMDDIPDDDSNMINSLIAIVQNLLKLWVNQNPGVWCLWARNSQWNAPKSLDACDWCSTRLAR